MDRSIIARLSAACAALLLVATAGRVDAQPGGSASEQALRGAITAHYEVTLLRNGVLLTPKDRRTGHAVEVTNGSVAVDGVDVSGAELRRQIGADADAILQLTYLDVTAQRQLFAGSGPSAVPDRSGVPGPPPLSREPRSRDDGRRVDEPGRDARRIGGIVRFGRDVTVAEDEVVDEDVVVIGASAKIDGQVRGDVVVIGGRADLGARAHLYRDLTVVGGTLDRHPNALIDGRVNEIGTGAQIFGGRRGDGASPPRERFRRGWPFSPMRPRPFAGLAGTILRLGALLVLASVIVFVAKGPVERIGERAVREPLKAGLVGLLIELMFVPTLGVAVVLLLVTIVGIPLLALVPVVLLVAVALLLVGFTSVAYQTGRWAAVRWGLAGGPYRTTLTGVLLLLAPIVLARVVGLAGGAIGFVTLPLAAVGFLIEYAAWTVGLGAAALVRFRPPAAEVPAAGASGPYAPA